MLKNKFLCKVFFCDKKSMCNFFYNFFSDKKILSLKYSEGHFFTKTDQPTDQPTMRRLELLWAAKNRIKDFLSEGEIF